MMTPQMYRFFGEDMVTIQVGQAPAVKEFKVHKRLISRSSDFFRSAFEGFFIEGSHQQLKLPEEHPDVFEAFCDWLYSGNIRHPSLYTRSVTPCDLFWLRMYTMADRQNNSVLQKLASDNIIMFDQLDQPESIPSAAFIVELFETLMPNKYLEHYVVHHVAAKLTGPHPDWKAWARVLGANDRFGAAVAIRVAKINSSNYKKCKVAPQNDPKFTQEIYGEVDTDPDDEEEHEDRPPFTIQLVWKDGSSVGVDVTADMTVAELKRLYIHGVKMDQDELSLHEYNIQEHSPIFVSHSPGSE